MMTAGPSDAGQKRPPFPIPLGTAPMEARSAAALPPAKEGPWQFELKWDGFRCLVFKSDRVVELRAKSGKPLGRYFPEVVAMLEQLRAKQFVLDGELVIEVDGQLSFDALQLRLHPAASRVRKLSVETPSRLVVFDILAVNGRSLMDWTLEKRRDLLETFMMRAAIRNRLVMSPVTRERRRAARWLAKAGKGSFDGVVAKPVYGTYRSGERAMIKVKRLRTADCVVGGFRYESRRRLVGSLLLGLYDRAGKLDHVGFTATIADTERAALTELLEGMKGSPGFTGMAPGGPSRWSKQRTGEWVPLKTKLVVEVRFDHVTNGRFRHGTTLMRWRPDKSPAQCTSDQLGFFGKAAE
jgi:ATP-dependent DNA ligase